MRKGFLIITLSLVLGLIVALSSCSSDDNNPVITTVYGLWKVVEIQTADQKSDSTNEGVGDDENSGEDQNTTGEGTDDENQEGEDNGEGKDEGDTDDGDPDEGDNSDPNDSSDDQEPEYDGKTFVRFKADNTYIVFRAEDTSIIEVISEGSYSFSGSTISFKENNQTAPIVGTAKRENKKLTINFTFSDKPQIWIAELQSSDPFISDVPIEDAWVDFEKTFHKADSIPGSIYNPIQVEGVGIEVSDTLWYAPWTVKPEIAQVYYYFKADSTKSYKLTVDIIEPEYKLPATFMEFVQVWVSGKPYAKDYIAMPDRIYEGEMIFEDISAKSSFIYVMLLSYQDNIRYSLKLEEE